MAKVLLTGGTGFIAGHCIPLLLDRGYEVVATVRNDDKGKKLLNAQPKTDKLTYCIVEDVSVKGAFDQVVKATPFDYIIHAASPFHYNVQDPVKDFLEPAVIGTTSIFEAAKAYAPSVKRIVLTSSFAAMRQSGQGPQFYDETSWNPITWDEAVSDTKKTYQGSKALAEKAAWSFMEKEKPNFDLAVINPTLIFGAVAPHLVKGELDSVNTSNLRMRKMIEGEMKDKLEPTGFYTWVDVSDVALAHVKALEIPEAGGKRFPLCKDHFTNKEIAKIISGMGSEYKTMLPDDIDGQEDDIPEMDQRYRISSQQSIDVLGIQYTDLATSVKNTVESLLKLKG